MLSEGLREFIGLSIVKLGRTKCPSRLDSTNIIGDDNGSSLHWKAIRKQKRIIWRVDLCRVKCSSTLTWGCWPLDKFAMSSLKFQHISVRSAIYSSSTVSHQGWGLRPGCKNDKAYKRMVKYTFFCATFHKRMAFISLPTSRLERDEEFRPYSIHFLRFSSYYAYTFEHLLLYCVE